MEITLRYYAPQWKPTPLLKTSFACGIAAMLFTGISLLLAIYALQAEFPRVQHVTPSEAAIALGYFALMERVANALLFAGIGLAVTGFVTGVIQLHRAGMFGWALTCILINAGPLLVLNFS